MSSTQTTERRRFPQTSIERWGAESEGATLVEYAILLVVIAASLLVTVELLGYLTRDSFTSVSTAMGTGEASDASSRSAAAKAPASSLTATATGDSWTRRLPLTMMVLAFVLNILLWVLVAQRRKREAREADAEPELTTADEENMLVKRQQLLHLFSSKPALIARNQLQVRHLMSRDVITATPEMRSEELEALMEQHQVRHLIIADAKGEIVGTVHHRDVVGRRNVKARSLAVRSTIVEADTPVAPAVSMLLNARARCLAVVRSGQLKGVLTTADIVMAFQCVLQAVESLDVEVTEEEPAAQTISAIVRMQELEAQAAQAK